MNLMYGVVLGVIFFLALIVSMVVRFQFRYYLRKSRKDRLIIEKWGKDV